MMSRLLQLLALLLIRARGEQCRNPSATNTSAPAGSLLVPRTPRSPISELPGLEEAVALLREAVVLPARLPPDAARLFRRSGERAGVLLAGPSGLGKAAAAEAAAAQAGALVLSLPAVAVEVAKDFCAAAVSASRSSGRPVVVVIEGLEAAPAAALSVGRCLREVANEEDPAVRVFIVATASRELSLLGATTLLPFGYVARLGLPSSTERKQFLLRLLAQISRIDPQWASSLRDAAVGTLANLTEQFTFAEVELVVRRAFIRSTNDEGTRDPVALHHFEQILADTQPTAAAAFTERSSPVTAGVVVAAGDGQGATEGKNATGQKGSKDPMDGIFGWCNLILPESLQLPPVVWAMVIFGVLAHFMARASYPPPGQRKRRGGPPGRSSLFGDMAASGGAAYPPFGDGLGELFGASSHFGAFPPPPGHEGLLRGAAGAGDAGATAPASVPSPAQRAGGE